MPRLLLLTLLLCPSLLGAQQYQFSNYGLNDGLAQSQVHCVKEDHKAYLWMGTNGGGLSRFNGLEFETFTINDGLLSNYVYALCEDLDNNLWIGTGAGLNRYKDGQFYNDSLWDEEIKITAICALSNDQLWIGTNKGLWEYNRNRVKILNIQGLKYKGDISFIETNGDEIWVGSDIGVSRVKNRNAKHFSKSSGLSGNLCRSICFDEKGGAWLGTYGNGLNHIIGDTIKELDWIPGLQRIVANDVELQTNGELWIATIRFGLCIVNLSDSSFTSLTENNGLANDYVNTIEGDRWGNKWLGTTGGGISKYSGSQFEHYDRNNGLKGNYIYALESSGDSLWLSSSAGGISLFQNKRALRYGLDSGFTDTKAKALFQSEDGLLWIGTEGSGMALFDGDTFDIYTTANGLGSNWVKSIDEDTLGRIWIATGGGGISRLDDYDTTGNPIFTRLREEDGLPSNRFLDIHVDHWNRVWFASRSGGLGYIENDSIIKVFSRNDSLLSPIVRSIKEDNNGYLWIGTDKGINTLFLYEERPQLKTFNGNSLLSSNSVYLIEIDKEGTLWVGTEKGVDRMTLQQKVKVLESFHFGDEEGFIGVETNMNASVTDQNGDVWFGTINGLHKYLSNVSINNAKAPILNFTTINLDYTPIEQTEFFKKRVEGRLVLPYNENNLTFDFLGITQTLPKKVRYQWRLDGLESNWSPISKRRSVNFSNLKPGDYTFMVKSVNENGVWNKDPLEFSFSITKPIWKENWFILSYSSFILLVLLTIITSRIRIVKRKARAKQEKILMEKDMAVLEQKALRLQMNPHFIFHTLNSIQALIATKEEDVAREYLSKFSRLMRQILENSRQVEVSLDTELETLENYLNIERFVNENKFNYQIEVSEELETEFIKIPPMIIQPFLENAILHGLSHKEGGKGELKLSFKDLGETLECTIEDNGVGRDKAAEHNATSNRQHKSTAMLVTSERLNFLSDDKNSLIIKDLRDKDGKGIGTRVTLRLPIAEAMDD